MADLRKRQHEILVRISEKLDAKQMEKIRKKCMTMNNLGERIINKAKQEDANEKVPVNNSENYVSATIIAQEKNAIDVEEKVIKQEDEAKINEIMETLGIENKNEKIILQKELQDYYGLENEDVEKIGIIKAKDLSENYKEQFEALADERLGNVNIAVIADKIWTKSQPSQSSAEKNLILVKQSYFEAQENPDEIAWMIHELAHCQNFMDTESAEQYQKNMQTFAFDDLKTKYPYPNNLVEKQTFSKQFEFLKKQGKSRVDIMSMLEKYYDESDTPFFEKLLNEIYGK